MNKALPWRDIGRTVGFMFVVTFVCISAVAGLRQATADVVARNRNLFLHRAVLLAAGLPPDDTPAAVAERFAERAQPLSAPGGAAYRIAAADGADAPARALVFVRTGAGLWGPIRAAIGLEPGTRRLTGLVIVDQNETPGLGARIAEEWFTSQFKGHAGPFAMKSESGRKEPATEFDAVTGATITSRAVRDLLNRTVAEAATAEAAGPSSPRNPETPAGPPAG